MEIWNDGKNEKKRPHLTGKILIFVLSSSGLQKSEIRTYYTRGVILLIINFTHFENFIQLAQRICKC